MKAIKYRTNEGERTALLVKSGRKFHHLLIMDLPLRVKLVPLSEARYFTDLVIDDAGKPYPLSRAKRIFRDTARSYYGNLRSAPDNVKAALR